tara:strand:- start:186 stop:806 length:621 start_codon:yes stop_codon:yes gene_type:complete
MEDTLSRLVQSLRCLPGVGPKSAQRMAYYLLNNKRQKGLHLAACLDEAMRRINHCNRCNNYTDASICSICQNLNRNLNTLCIVEQPSDVSAIEQSGVYTGQYFVLMNKVSPLDGVGPKDIGLEKIEELVSTRHINEVIIALSPSVESQTTIYFIQEQLKHLAVKVSQLAHGIPSGGELEYLDSHTIGQALKNRSDLLKQLNSTPST